LAKLDRFVPVFLSSILILFRNIMEKAVDDQGGEGGFDLECRILGTERSAF
jgi:hypothetical protein